MCQVSLSDVAMHLKVIRERRHRSNRWISSSIPEAQWNTELARFSSPEYHVNNLLSPVLFQEALEKVPTNAITIEIAPHCLLQAILKRSLGSDCTFVGLMHRSQQNNLEYFLSSLGKYEMTLIYKHYYKFSMSNTIIQTCL